MQTNLFRKNSGETDQEHLLYIQCYEWKYKDWSDQLEMTIRLLGRIVHFKWWNNSP